MTTNITTGDVLAHWHEGRDIERVINQHSANWAGMDIEAQGRILADAGPPCTDPSCASRVTIMRGDMSDAEFMEHERVGFRHGYLVRVTSRGVVDQRWFVEATSIDAARERIARGDAMLIDFRPTNTESTEIREIQHIERSGDGLPAISSDVSDAPFGLLRTAAAAVLRHMDRTRPDQGESVVEDWTLNALRHALCGETEAGARLLTMFGDAPWGVFDDPAHDPATAVRRRDFAPVLEGNHLEGEHDEAPLAACPLCFAAE